MICLVWVYYSAQILFLGAELTDVYAHARGSAIEPEPEVRPRGRERRRPTLAHA